MKGLVIKTTGPIYSVRDDQGRLYQCRLKGNLRLRDFEFTNPIVVGDIVTFELTGNQDYSISDLDERKNYIVRRSIKLSKQIHIIAANIDQAVLMVTLSHPKTYAEFIDRYLVTSGAYHIPTILLFNKTDLYKGKELEEFNLLFNLYSCIGYKCFSVSALKDSSFEEVKRILKDKITLFSGYSGVGKTTLLNRLDSGLNLKTSLISEAFQAGKHTTTYAEMHELKNIGMVIDTPGIKGLGVIDIPRDEISHYFPEMLKVLNNCKFHNCTHIDEPSCAVKKALEEGEISKSRYKSYLSIFYEENEKYR